MINTQEYYSKYFVFDTHIIDPKKVFIIKPVECYIEEEKENIIKRIYKWIKNVSI